MRKNSNMACYDKALWAARHGPIAQKSADNRSAFQRDLGILLHSDAFRRLQGKTQVLPPDMGDFHRTRLTHSLEVAQIGRGIIWQLQHGATDALQVLLVDSELIETICLAHDIGHPPFGHGGEIGLNRTMRTYGGFEGNAQTLRILAKLGHHSPGFGLNLTRRALLGVMKYPVFYSNARSRVYEDQVARFLPVKALYDEESGVVDFVFEPFNLNDRTMLQSLQQQPSAQGHGSAQYHSLDASIMELADDIAYATHDLEDAIKLDFITAQTLEAALPSQTAVQACQSQIEQLKQASNNHDRPLLKNAISGLIHGFVTHITLVEREQFEHPLLRYHAVLEPAYHSLLTTLKTIVLEKVIQRKHAKHLIFNRHHLMRQLFDAYLSNPDDLLPEALKHACDKGETIERLVCDYISGMTDDYAVKMYQDLFVPKRQWWVR